MVLQIVSFLKQDSGPGSILLIAFQLLLEKKQTEKRHHFRLLEDRGSVPRTPYFCDTGMGGAERRGNAHWSAAGRQVPTAVLEEPTLGQIKGPTEGLWAGSSRRPLPEDGQVALCRWRKSNRTLHRTVPESDRAMERQSVLRVSVERLCRRAQSGARCRTQCPHLAAGSSSEGLAHLRLVLHREVEFELRWQFVFRVQSV